MKEPTREIVNAVNTVLDYGARTGQLFKLADGTRGRQSHFYEFTFTMPPNVDADPALVRDFFAHLRYSVARHGLVGPKRRPLTLVPKPRKQATGGGRCDDDCIGSSVAYSKVNDLNGRNDFAGL